MIGKYHNHKQTHVTARKSNTSITRHQEDKPSKTVSSLFLPIKAIAKPERTQSNAQHNNRTITDSHYRSNNKQKVNSNRSTTPERTATQATGGSNAPHWLKILTPDSPAVETQEMFSPHGSPHPMQRTTMEKHSNQINTPR